MPVPTLPITPPGWSRRESRRSQERAGVIQVGTFPLPEDDNGLGLLAMTRMRPDDLLVSVIDFGVYNAELFHPVYWREGTLPLSIGNADVSSIEGPTRPTAVRHVIIDGQALMIVAAFGSDPPGEEAFVIANEVIGTLALTPS